MFERDLRRDRLWWSPQVLEIFGFPSDGPAPAFEEFLAIVFEEDVSAFREALASAAGSDDAVTIPYRYRFWRGEELRWAEAHIEALREDGEVVGYRGAVQDRTEREREVIAARRELTVRASLLDAVDAAVAATDPEGLVTHWNACAERLYGWSADEVLGKPLVAFAVGDNKEEAERITSVFFATGHWKGDFEIPHRDGSRVLASLHLSAIRDPDGDPVGAVAVSVDIGARLATENDLRRARDYLQAVTASMAEGLITLDSQGRLSYMNDAADELLGWRQEGLIGEPIAAVAMTPLEPGCGPRGQCVRGGRPRPRGRADPGRIGADRRP